MMKPMLERKTWCSYNTDAFLIALYLRSSYVSYADTCRLQ